MRLMDTNTYLIKRIINTHIVITILVTLTATVSTVINGIITGQMLGPDALTALGFASPIFILLGAVSGIFGNGGTIVCAKYIGAGDMKKVSLNYTSVTVASFISGIVLLICCIAMKDILAGVLGAKGAIKSMTADYIMALGIAAVPFLFLQNLLLYLRMDNDQRLALISMIVTIAVNTAFAYWSCACTDLGLFGIGLSIFVGNVVGLICVLPHFRRKERMLRFGSMTGAKDELKIVVKAGVPTAINRGSQTLKNLVLNAFLVAYAGNVAVLALSVQTNVYQFLIAISTGYGLMMAMMCGIFYGERDKRAISDTLKVAVKSGFLVSLVAGIIVFVFAEQLASMFIGEGGDLQMAATCLRYFALSQPTSTLCLILLYMYQTMGNLVMSSVISLTRGFFYVVLISICLAPVFGLDIVWLSFFLADVLSILTIAAVIWKKTGHFPRKLDDFILAPEGAFDCDVICDISVRNDPQEVIGLSDRISAMCYEKGVDQDKANRAALCIEEMASNVVDHAYDDSKEHFIDIRIIRNGGDLIFRMRDDGVPFNPLNADTEGHFGIKVVRAAAKSIDYRYSVKLNNLTVTI